MYFLLGISLMLALLLVLNLLVAAAANVLWRFVAPAADGWTARRRAQVIFALRIFPFVAALLFVVLFLLPAYLLFEPHFSEEIVSVKLALLAFVSTLGVGIAACRIFGTWWRTRRLVADWLARAETISVAEVKIPVYRIKHPFPVMAVVGTFRPRMFVAEQIFAALDGEEFQAAIRHEFGHLAARDNFKRTLMRVCRDLLVFPSGRRLDRAWSENVESAADEYAAQTGGATAALNLASALLKIARIVPPGTRPAMPTGAFLIEAQTAAVAWRVRHLLRLSENKIIPAEFRSTRLNYLPLFYSAGIFAVVLLFATNYNFLLQIHRALEGVVAILQ